jgi:hypothetical protein
MRIALEPTGWEYSSIFLELPRCVSPRSERVLMYEVLIYI